MVAISPIYQASAQVQYGSNQSQFSITGVTPEFASVQAYTVAQGRFISNNDNSAESRVVVLGSQAATDLFSGLNPMGRKITIDGINFTVVGVLASKGSTGFFSQDEVILIPLETGYSRLFGGRALDNGKRVLSTISLSAANPNAVNEVISQVEFILRRRSQLDPSRYTSIYCVKSEPVLEYSKQHHQHIDHIFRSHCRYFTLRGRDWDHEYHVGIRP